MSAAESIISVIIPCYNAAPYLRETLASALAQTLPPLEILVIDDGSTDDSAAIAESFGPPVHVIRQPNQGESVARNRGIAIARSSHLMFLDADDLLQPSALARLSAAGERGQVVLMGYQEFDADPAVPTATFMPQCESLLPAAFWSCIAPPIAWLFPRELVGQLGGFNERIRHGEDWDFIARMALAAPPFRTLQFAGALYRRHRGNQSSNQLSRARSLEFQSTLLHICELVFADPESPKQWGETLFWKCLHEADWYRKAGLTNRDMAPLFARIKAIAKMPPVNRTGMGRLVNVVGPRAAIWWRTNQKSPNTTNQNVQQERFAAAGTLADAPLLNVV